MAPRLRRKRSAAPGPDGMTLVQHLGELRRRLIVSLAATAVGAVLAFALYEPILGVLLRPYCNAIPKGRSCALLATSLLDGLNLRFKVSLYAGFAFASPVVFWQVWRFVTPGLKGSEKRYAVPFIASSVVLFGSGATVAYLVLHRALRFLQAVGGPHLRFFYTAPNYLSFVLAMMAAFGVAFELPLILVALQLVGVVTPSQLSAWRRWAIVAIFAGVALFIPSGDPVSLFAMAVPMTLLYEAAILTGRLVLRSRRQRAVRATGTSGG